MKAIQLHYNALIKMIMLLSKGKYLLFFLPGLVIAFIFWQFFLLSETAEESLSVVNNVPLIGEYLQAGIKGTFSLLEFILEQIFIFFILTLLSPFNTILSERVDTDLTGRSYPFDIFQVLSDLMRMIFVVGLAVTLELITLGVYWIISWIFNLGAIDQVMYFIIAAFYFGFSFYDYSLERYHQGVFTSLGFGFSKMLLLILSGSFFLLIYNIPYIGVVFAPVLTVIISTIVYVNATNKVSNSSSIKND